MSDFKAIDQIARVRRGASPRPIDDPKWFGGVVGWVRITDVTRSRRYLRSTEQYLSTLGEARSVRVNKGDLIMSICATIGRPVIVDMAACIHDGFVQFCDIKDVDTVYMYYCLQNAERDFLSYGQVGTQANLNTSIVGRHKLFVPSLPKQLKIAKVLTALDNLIEKTEALISKYQAVKQGMMHDLFTRGVDEHGHLRPTHSEAPYLYKPSPLGWIPKSWETLTLNDLVSPQRPIVYGILMPGYGHPGGVPVIKVKDIKQGVVETGDLLLTSPDIDDAYRRSKTSPGDLLFTIRGTVGRTAFVPTSLDGANITQDTARVGIVRGDARFVRGYLEMPIPSRFIAWHTLGVAVQGINLRDVRRIPVAFPLFDEQARIGDILDGLDRKVSDERLYLDKLRLLKFGLMHDLLTGRVRVNAESFEGN